MPRRLSDQGVHYFAVTQKHKRSVKPIAPRMTKTLRSFGHSECNRVKQVILSSSRDLEIKKKIIMIKILIIMKFKKGKRIRNILKFA